MHKTIDYAKLFDLAYNLSSPNKSHNVDGLESLLGVENTSKFVRWYDASIMGIKAAKAIIERVSSREIRVQEVIWYYENM